MIEMSQCGITLTYVSPNNSKHIFSRSMKNRTNNEDHENDSATELYRLRMQMKEIKREINIVLSAQIDKEKAQETNSKIGTDTTTGKLD